MSKPAVDAGFASDLLNRTEKLGAKLTYTYIKGTLYSRSELIAAAQVKSAPARAAKKLDDSLLTGKKPSADIDKRQQLATPGETIPIVFGKRVDDIGGVWVQPSLVKAGTRLYVGSFLYAISQGKIISSPVSIARGLVRNHLHFLLIKQ